MPDRPPAPDKDAADPAISRRPPDPQHHNPRRGLLLALALVLSVALLSVLCRVLWQRDPDVVLENHLLENAQATFLGLAAVLNLWRGHSARSDFDKYARMAMALFAISMLLREVDIARADGSRYLDGIELGLRILVGVGWVVFAVKLFPRRAMIQGRSGAVLRSPFFLLVGLGCMFYAASYPFDKFEPVIFELNSVLVEEALQLNASFMFLLTGFVRPLGGSTLSADDARV